MQSREKLEYTVETGVFRVEAAYRKMHLLFSIFHRLWTFIAKSIVTQQLMYVFCMFGLSYRLLNGVYTCVPVLSRPTCITCMYAIPVGSTGTRV